MFLSTTARNVYNFKHKFPVFKTLSIFFTQFELTVLDNISRGVEKNEKKASKTLKLYFIPNR